jgi:hypothetical protein
MTKAILLTLLFLATVPLSKAQVMQQGIIATPAASVGGGGASTVTFVSGGNQGANTCASDSGASPLTFTCPISSQTNQGVVVHALLAYSGTTPTNITATINGVSMTQAGFHASTATTTASADFCLPNTAVGTESIVVTSTGGTVSTLYADAEEYSGVNQTTCVRSGSFGFSDTTANGSGQLSLIITSATGDRTTSTGSNAIIALTSNQTLRTNDQNGSAQMVSDDAAGAATVTHTYTAAASDPINITGFSLAHQ